MLRNTGGGSQRHAFKEAVAVDGGGLNLWPMVLFGAHMHQRSGEDSAQEKMTRQASERAVQPVARRDCVAAWGAVRDA